MASAPARKEPEVTQLLECRIADILIGRVRWDAALFLASRLTELQFDRARKIGHELGLKAIRLPETYPPSLPLILTLAAFDVSAD